MSTPKVFTFDFTQENFVNASISLRSGTVYRLDTVFSPEITVPEGKVWYVTYQGRTRSLPVYTEDIRITSGDKTGVINSNGLFLLGPGVDFYLQSTYGTQAYKYNGRTVNLLPSYLNSGDTISLPFYVDDTRLGFIFNTGQDTADFRVVGTSGAPIDIWIPELHILEIDK